MFKVSMSVNETPKLFYLATSGSGLPYSGVADGERVRSLGAGR